MNPADNVILSSRYPNLLCACKLFAKDLLAFTRDTVLDLSEQQLQKNKFEVFLKQYSCHINDVNGIRVETCSQKVCECILWNLKNWNGIKLITGIFQIICLIYQAQKSPSRCCVSDIYIRNEYVFLNGTEDKKTYMAIDGESEYMKLLVNFDLLSSLNKPSPIYIERITGRIVDEWMMDGDFENKYLKTCAIVKMATVIFARAKYHGSLRRIYLTMNAIRAAQLNLGKKENKAKEYIYCLRMYFAITRDPFLTINEVRIVLYACLIFQEKIHLYELFYKEFMKIMPECSAKFEPRNLTDLARCQIRENLKKCNLHLPAAVVKLNLAQPLKEFILGDVIQMSRKSGNVFRKQIITKSELDEMLFEGPEFYVSQMEFKIEQAHARIELSDFLEMRRMHELNWRDFREDMHLHDHWIDFLEDMHLND